MPVIRGAISQYLAEIQRRGASKHTVRNYASDLRQFAEYFEPQGSEPPNLEELDLPVLREWLASLYDQGLETVSVRRKLAAVRAVFKFARTEGLLVINPAARLRTPKVKQHLPEVMTAEKTNRLLDQSAAIAPERDLAILELLYGCGIRVSELVGLDLGDVDVTQGWLRVLGKGNKQRQVPMLAGAGAALERYLPLRAPRQPGERAIFLNSRGERLGDREVRRIVKRYGLLTVGDAGVHPHGFRHAYATHLLSEGADLRAIQELLGHARLSTTQKYTQVTLTSLQAVYDRAHPKA